MSEQQDQFDSGLTPGEEQRLGTRLRQFYGQSVAVPGVVDETIRARARAVLQRQGRARTGTRRMAWWMGGGVSAAAAIITLAIILWPSKLSDSPLQPPVARDLNRDGQVNMLDAYVLARRVALKQPVGRELDVNGDGIADAKDADAIAHDAVALKSGGTPR